jgi:hypothetical protein
MNNENTHLIDSQRSVSLHDVGLSAYRAVVSVDPDGREHFVLAQRAAINDQTVLCDLTCADVEHEKVGELPLEFVRRIAISSRTNRCDD